jgi:hypothetical protein
LASIAWPEKVRGAALALERVLLPPEAEQDLPDGGDTDASSQRWTPTRGARRCWVATGGEHLCLRLSPPRRSTDGSGSGATVGRGAGQHFRLTSPCQRPHATASSGGVAVTAGQAGSARPAR